MIFTIMRFGEYLGRLFLILKIERSGEAWSTAYAETTRDPNDYYTKYRNGFQDLSFYGELTQTPQIERLFRGARFVGIDYSWEVKPTDEIEKDIKELIGRLVYVERET